MARKPPPRWRRQAPSRRPSYESPKQRKKRDRMDELLKEQEAARVDPDALPCPSAQNARQEYP